MENRYIAVEYSTRLNADTGEPEWERMLEFNTTREGVAQAFAFAAELETRMLLADVAMNCRVTTYDEKPGLADISFVDAGESLKQFLESSWSYGFVAEQQPITEEDVDPPEE